MKVLVSGFDREATDHLSGALREAGHQVLGATGRSSSRTLARVATPEAVLVPTGEAGALARSWLEDLVEVLAGARVVEVPRGADVAHLLAQEPSPLHFPGDPAPPRDPDPLSEASAPGSSEGVPRRTSTARMAGRVPREPRPPGELEPTQPLIEIPGAEERATSGLNLPRVVTPRREPSPLVERSAGPIPTAAQPDSGRPGRTLRPTEDMVAPNLAAKLDEVRFQDYHCILEVEADATQYTVREAYQRLSALYSPTGWPWPVAAADVLVLDEIGRGLQDACAVLGEPELRARYERALLEVERARPAGLPDIR